MLVLSPVSKENWIKVMKLKIRDDQKGFVADNVKSLAQAYVYQECVPLAIIEDAEPVGFCMYAKDDSDGSYWILRLMIDQKHQSRGLGRQAMELLLDRIREDKSRHTIYLSFEPENSRARALYISLGFISDNRVEDGEEVYKLAY